MDANDTEHIWLRQTVTYSVDGQTRTLEIGIPLPRTATAQDVEALLGVAETGMRAISQRLDAQIVAADAGEEEPETPVSEAINSAITANSTTTPELPKANPPVEMAHTVASANGRAPRATPPAAEPESAGQREPGAASQTHNASESTESAPSATRTSSAPPAPPQVTERPATPPARPAPVAAQAGAEMTRPQFLTAAAELGLNPRQAMDRLGVRSLEGLNLREGLESLRRQLLGASASAPEPEPENEHIPAAAASAPPSTSARYFEEEDDETILFSMDEDDELMDGDFAPSGGAAHARGDDDLDVVNGLMDDEDDLEDAPHLPDLAPPAPVRQMGRPAGRKAPTAAQASDTAPREEQAVASPNGARTHAMQLIGKLRTAAGGGPASDYQRTAYRNIVEDELGKAQAVALVRGLWRTTADRLTAAQLEALIRWGKEEVFSEEAAQVIAALRAEQRRAEQAASAANEEQQAPHSGARGRPGGGSR